MSVALAIVLSVAIGVSLGLIGGGGSILTVPILVYVLGLDARSAIAMSLLVVGITSVAALVPHAAAGRVSFATGGALGAASMVGAFVGGRLARSIPPGVLLVAFAVTMLVTGLAMMRRRTTASAGTRRGIVRVAASGVGVGLLTGTVGAGGGFLIVPTLVLLCGLEITTAVATSLFVIAINSFAGLTGYLGSVSIDVRLAALVAAAAVGGSVLGARWAGWVHPDTLRRGFAWFVLGMGVFMVGRQTSALGGAISLGVALAGTLAVRKPWRTLGAESSR